MEIFAHTFMNKTVGTFNLPEGVFLSSESFFLIILAPILAALYHKLQKIGRDPAPPLKTVLSLLFLSACFLIMVVGSKQIPADAKSADVSWGYLVGAYFMMALGEMFLAPIGLSTVSRLSHPRYTALMVGMWYACVGIAFFNGGMLASLMEKMGGLYKFFSIFVFMTLVPAIVLYLFSSKLTKLSQNP
jgi:POT family proton-dependent oligopeptide transporter